MSMMMPEDLAAAFGAPPVEDPAQDLALALEDAEPAAYGSDEEQAVTHLQRAIQSLQDYQAVEPDAEDVAVASQAETALKKLLAKDQKQAAATVKNTAPSTLFGA